MVSQNPNPFLYCFLLFPGKFILPVEVDFLSSFLPYLLLFIYFWLCWVFVAGEFFSSDEQGLLSSCSEWLSHCHGFSCCGVLALACGLQ